jgi:hypothetical protein
MPVPIREGIAPSRPDAVFFIDPDNEVWHASYTAGRWMARNRWRGFELRHRRAARPYLQAGTVRVPVRVLPEYHEPEGDIF